MCMIAGYIGQENACTKLVELIERQEAIFGGYYSGLAIISDGILSRSRAVGSLAKLKSEGNIDSLKGTIGVAHSRTNDGGGIEWSQPRFDERSTIATVGVGTGGVFRSRETVSKLVDELLESNVVFRTRTLNGKKNGFRRARKCFCL